MDDALKGNSGLSADIAEPLSALELNNIKLDVKHTILTPEYLEKKQSFNPTINAKSALF